MTDKCILMTAGMCHDLDHPGYNNTYVPDMPTLSDNNTSDNTDFGIICSSLPVYLECI